MVSTSAVLFTQGESKLTKHFREAELLSTQFRHKVGQFQTVASFSDRQFYELALGVKNQPRLFKFVSHHKLQTCRVALKNLYCLSCVNPDLFVYCSEV